MYRQANSKRREVYLCVAVIAMSPMLGGCPFMNGDQSKTVALKFAAVVGDAAATCSTMYEGLGVTSESAEILDLRFYVSNIRLVNLAGEETLVTLEQDGTWQVDNVTLLDFENGTGKCGDTGTTEVNAAVHGSVPIDEYVAVIFDVGVPFEMNHDDLAASPSPLNVSAMYWAWAIGHKFIRVDLQTEGGLRWNMHLGSTMCESNGPADPPVAVCGRPNMPTIRLDSFDPDLDTIVFDVRELFSSSDLTSDTPDTASGCQTFPDDVNECGDLFPNLGMDFTTGACVDGCSGQRVFKVSRDASGPVDAQAAIERGEVAFQLAREAENGSSYACVGCHGPDGSGLVGPDIRAATADHLLEHAQGDGPHPDGVKFPSLTASDADDIAVFLASICEMDPACEPGSSEGGHH